MKKLIQFSKYIFLALVLSGLSSCEKDRLTLLTDGIWNFSNLTTGSDDAVAKAFVASYKAAHTDATLEFFDDGTYEKVFSLVIETETGDWELFGESQLVFTIGDFIYQASIDKLKKDELVYLETYLDGEGNPYPAKFSWVR